MAATKGLGTTGDGAGVVTPLDHKLAQAGLIAKVGAGSNLIRPGLFYDGVSNIVTGTAGMSYNVAAFTCVTTRGAAAGAVLLTNDGTVNVVTTAAPGSNSRIDSVYLWPREFSLDGVDSTPVIGVVQGTAAVSPVAPSLAAFPGAIELARITVPAGVTATNSGTTITQMAPFTTLQGGVLVFRNATERDAATVPDGQRCYLLDTDVEYVRANGAWVDSLNTIYTRRQLDTTNDSGRFLVQQGIGKIAGPGSSPTATEAVTFPVAFAATPVVVVTGIGFRATGAYNPTSLSASQSVVGSAQGVSTTGFNANLYQATGSNLSAAQDWYYNWIAIGVAA